jgi:hypothetical protein
LIKKANISNDTAIAKNLNTAISVAGVLDGVDSFEDAIAAVREQGFLLANLNAKTDGCYFVWEAQSKQFLLVDTKDDFKVLYSANKDYAPIGATWNIITSDLEAAAELEQVNSEIVIKRTVRATADMNKLINSGEEVLVYVDESVVIGDTSFIDLNKEGAVVTVDFGNAKVQGGTDNADLKAYPVYVQAGTMNIKNGIVNATSAFIDADGKTLDLSLLTVGGVLNVEGTKFEFTNKATNVASICYGTANFKNVTFSAPIGNTMVGAYDGASVVLEDCTVDAVNHAVFSSSNGGKSTITIKSGNYHTFANLLGAHGGVVAVEGGTFNCDSANKVFKFYDVVGSQFVITGGTFNGVAFENLDETTILGMCNTSALKNTKLDIVFADGAWTLTVVAK